MEDTLGKVLAKWRVDVVSPEISGRLLDIGCGNNFLARSTGNGIGVDVHNWSGVDLVVEDCARLPFRDGEFGTVTIIAALNHIPNRELVLKEAHRVLEDNGLIVVTMLSPFISMIWHKLRSPWDSDQKHRGMMPGEVYGLNHNTVFRLLNNAGFVFQRKKHFMLWLNSVYVFRKR
jgi:ubiquinone/menaquinone biosynthesis C-methylase UbiE